MKVRGFGAAAVVGILNCRGHGGGGETDVSLQTPGDFSALRLIPHSRRHHSLASI